MRERERESNGRHIMGSIYRNERKWQFSYLTPKYYMSENMEEWISHWEVSVTIKIISYIKLWSSCLLVSGYFYFLKSYWRCQVSFVYVRYIQLCGGKCLTTGSSGQKKKKGHRYQQMLTQIAFADICVINTSVMTDFRQPMWGHWTQSYEERHTINSIS